MGGRGKSSGAPRARVSTTIATPMNFGGPGVITLEQLEAADAKRVGPDDLAKGVEEAIERMLAAPPNVYAKHQAVLERTLAEMARKLKGRPEAEREAFGAALAPLLGRLREQAEGRPS